MPQAAEGKINAEVLAWRVGKRLGEWVEDIKEYVQGRHHKTYLVILRSGVVRLVRVHCPVSRKLGSGVTPATKMQSEIATMKHVLKCTRVPVPEVFVYDADADGGVGGEWMVMEYVQGVPLDECWVQMTADERASVVAGIIAVLAELVSLRFPAIGSLQEDEQGLCVVGPMTFTPSRNVHDLAAPDPASCGPYRNYLAWLESLAMRRMSFDSGLELDPFQKANVDINLARIKGTSILIPSGMQELCGIALEHPEFTLDNILVDPYDPGRIKAVIDWEGARTVPLWAIQPRPFRNLDLVDHWVSNEDKRKLQEAVWKGVGCRAPMWQLATGSERVPHELRMMYYRAWRSTMVFSPIDFHYWDRAMRGETAVNV
ncbi:hypothetical protein GLOTRDRAFT_129463 [Gloeophyllum trabeum ATCC 11539]|uniref:Aminoglycoside phosphotransferase domain-containing protein n=1 Tax=Gloeophyllum trabeum (strain ATCC 11539 / FP-39264 / Madison 617) TaxID=670483 RepID=S7Q6W4_GLOTA|nr:uncharacterized protein GLOTRDRAFT_129463 [Gloeophyllum trabeum ATCC 11539]EPQ55173.1 hypothetical protein GLOTRDRAFT_129463 [Gloeophyllum trabeum ATCC 11539]